MALDFYVKLYRRVRLRRDQALLADAHRASRLPRRRGTSVSALRVTIPRARGALRPEICKILHDQIIILFAVSKRINHLRSLFRDAVDILGLTAEEQARLLNGKSVKDDSAFTDEALRDLAEPLAQLSIVCHLLVNTFEEARAMTRITALPNLEGRSIADCFLSRDQKKIAHALHAMEVHLDVA